MKTLRTIILTLAALAIVHAVKANDELARAGNQPAAQGDAKASKSYLDNISVSPFGTIVHDGIGDGESYGAGLSLGLGINKFVSIELSAVTYSDNNWRDEAIDETAILGKFRLIKNANETFSAYGLAGGDRDWGRDDFALSVGGGLQLRIHKQWALFADSRLRAWLNANDGKSKDISTRAGISLSF